MNGSISRSQAAPAVLALALVVAWFGVVPLTAARLPKPPKTARRAKTVGTLPASQPAAAASAIDKLDRAVEAIDGGLRAMQANDAKTAQLRLTEARLHVLEVRRMIEQQTPSAGKARASRFVNTHCPVMGTPIDPDKVPAEWTRTHKGGLVAFCCQGCVQIWDNLTDKEKDERLAKATRTAAPALP